MLVNVLPKSKLHTDSNNVGQRIAEIQVTDCNNVGQRIAEIKITYRF
jgi:NADH/NAD ratio-sensing transcriptional regulator Rex